MKKTPAALNWAFWSFSLMLIWLGTRFIEAGTAIMAAVGNDHTLPADPPQPLRSQ